MRRGRPAVTLLALLVLAFVLALVAQPADGAASRLTARTRARAGSRLGTGGNAAKPVIFGSLPEAPPATSARYRKWLKLVRLGYEGGAAERALDAEVDDVDRAAVRLSREESGLHGLHCLSKGNCFGDRRNTVFRTPQSVSVPVRPPALAAPPPPQSPREAQRQKARDAAHASDPTQKFNPGTPPKLNPFPTGKAAEAVAAAQKQTDASPVTNMENHHREDAAVRRTLLAPSKKADMFQALMRSWFTTIQSPFHTRKPNGPQHESKDSTWKLPADTHMPMAPAHMHLSEDKKTVHTQYYAPPGYESLPQTALAAGEQFGARDLDAEAAEEAQAWARDHASDPGAPLEALDRADLARNVPVLHRPLSAAEEQEAELMQGLGGAAADQPPSQISALEMQQYGFE